MSKKGGEFEINAIDFLEKIFTELKYIVTRKRTQKSGSQDGYDDLIDIVDHRNRHYTIYAECKDYSTNLNYTQAIEKIPHIVSTHEDIHLLLFISPYQDFSNTNENSKVEGFYQAINDKCPVDFLTPESYIREYFSLYPDLYKKVYKNDEVIIEEKDREILLRKFEKLIFSSKNLKRIVVLDEDKEKYIGTNTIDEFHIARNFRKFQDNDRYSFENPDYNFDLLDYLNNSKLGVVILGNPGYGKSEELKNFSVQLWNMMDQDFKIPKFQSLTNFSSDTKIEDLLPPDYKNMYDLVIIFDGLDEVHNIIDFSNKFRNFISDNSDLINRSRMKFIISCRTSIYNKCIKDLKNLDICFLNEVSEGSAIRFLFRKFKLDITTSEGFSFYKYRDILENPFYLEILGQNYKKTGETLLNKTKLIEKYVESRLELDENNKFRNDLNFDKSEILESSKKIALALESMQRTSISKSEISFICKNKIDVFKNPFLKETVDNDIWSFEHKNIQEYFVAKVLSKLDFEEIIDILKIDKNSNKIHPTWINVVSFLLNLDLKPEVFDKLVEWISTNDMTFIFEADRNRISGKVKIKCLRQIFEQNCLKDTIWISNSMEVGIFSNLPENVDYLLDQVKNKSLHVRARISAINLLSHMSFGPNQIIELESIIFQIIDEFEENNTDKLYLLYESFSLIRNSTLKDDLKFYQSIFDKLKDYDHKDVIDGIISSIPKDLISSNIDYFLNILQKSIDRKWTNPSSIRNLISRKESIFNVFKRITDPDSLLKVYAFLIERHKNYEIKESRIADFLSHLKKIFENSSDLVKDELSFIITDAVLNDKIRYFEDDLLVEMVKVCKIQKKVFEQIFENLTGTRAQNHFLSEIIEQNCFETVILKYNDQEIDEAFIVDLRENIAYYSSVDLAIDFESFVETNSRIKFTEKLNKEEFNKKLNLYRRERQREFDVLFNIRALENQMKEIFKFKNAEELSHKDVEKFDRIFYKTENLRETVTINAKDLLLKILRKNFKISDSLKVNDLLKFIDLYSLDIMVDIFRSLPSETNQDVTISQDQIMFIKNWCINNTDRMNNIYRDYMLTGVPWEEKDYLTFKTIFKFQKYFNFKLDEELLLNFIWLNSCKEDANLHFTEDHVSKDKIEERIIENVNKTDDESSIFFYIKYITANNLGLNLISFDIKDKVRALLLSNDTFYARKYIELLFIDDVVFLKGLLNIKYNKTLRHFLDFVLGALIKKKELSFVEKFLMDKYNSLIQDNVMEETNIIKNLILANSEMGFKKLKELIFNCPDQNVSIENHFSYGTWQQFSNQNSIDDLIEILDFSMINYSSEQINNAHFSPVRITTEAIINICNSHNSEVCERVLSRLQLINTNRILEKGRDLFYINKLKKDVNEISINHKSLPYNIKKAGKLIEDHEHIFYN